MIAIDFETALLDGTPSLDFYRHDFRATSAAFAWFGESGEVKTKFARGEEEIRELLSHVGDRQLIVHNFSFEFAVLRYRFPEFDLNLYADTMRLAQVSDAGGDSEKPSLKLDDLLAEVDDIDSDSSGFKLDNVAKRWLGTEYHNHKEEAHSWLRNNKGIKKGKEGQHLNLLPEDIFVRYNVADAVVTLKLYKVLTEYLRDQKYNWEFDHQLYRNKCKHIVQAKGEGVKVDREALKIYKEELDKKIASYYYQIKEAFPNEIAQIENEKLEAIKAAYKTDKGRESGVARAIEEGEHLFKISSALDKKRLLIDLLGFKSPFKTPSGDVSFKKTHIDVFGKFGEIIKDRGTTILSKNQAENILGLSEYDGRVHLNLRAVATASGRLAGGN